MSYYEEVDMNRLQQAINSIINETPDYLYNYSARIFRPSDLRITSRTINNWSENDLLPMIKQDGWHKFNLTESLWLKLIVVLREFNLPLKTIKTIKDQLFESYIALEEVNTHSFILENITKTIENLDLTTLKEILESDEFKSIIERMELKLLGYLIFNIILVKENLWLICKQDGEILIHKGRLDILNATEERIKNFIKAPHITINLNQQLFEITNELIEDNQVLRNYKFISDEELIVLDAIRDNKTSKIELTFSQNGKPEMLKVSEKNRASSSQKIKELMINGAYLDIKLITEKNKVVYCECTRKIKF